MKLQNIKVGMAAAYMVVVGTAGLAMGVASVAGWVAVGSLAVLPTIAMLTLWKHPTATLSETIQAARR